MNTTGWTFEESCFNPPERENRFFSLFQKHSDWLWDQSSPYSPGAGGYFLGVKVLGCEAYCLPTYSVEIKNKWSYISTPLCLYGVHRNNFASTNPSMQKISVCMLYATLQCSRAPVLYAGGSLY
jgi:hypothetical protein